MSINPLAIDLKKQLGWLQERLAGSGSQHLRALQNASSRATFLATLSRALLEPSLTTPIVHAFRPILIDLCSRWLENGDLVEEKLEALCLLVQTHEELFPILSSFLRNNVPQEGPLAFVSHASSVRDIDTKRLHRALLAYYRILEANGELPSLYWWPLEPLSALIWTPHPDPAVRFMAVRCYALQSGMGEGEREKMELEAVGKIDEVDCRLNSGKDASGKDVIIDAWVIAATEARRVQEEREIIGADNTDFYGEQEPIHQMELSPLVVDVYGVLMFRQPGPTQAPNLIPTPTSIAALRSLALHISLSLPTLLTSAPSAGKSLLLSHLASTLHPSVTNQIVTLPLADTSLDPRALLGSYVSSPTKPGTFEWREGVLVRAMRAGRWLVLEDIDKGSAEVLGTLAPLAASLAPGVRAIGGRARLNVPGREVVVAEEGFRLFATRSVPLARNGTFSKPVFNAAHKFAELAIDTPRVDELQTIVDARFPRIRGSAAAGAIALWAAMKDLGSGGAGARPIGLRELDKFCSRLSSVLPVSFQTFSMDTDPHPFHLLPLVFTNPSLREDIFLEARDVFFGAGTTTTNARAHGDAMAALAAEHLALAPETRNALLQTRAAEFAVDRDANGNATAVRAGRVRLPAAPLRGELLQPHTPQRPFAMHKPARALLARIGAAISLAEPVLLTGETGTGKTSAVTHLAGLLRKNLVSLNLSQQSEGADLVGGFKPVEARIMGGEISERWTGLFRATFSTKKNPRFEGDVQKAMREGKWKRVVGLWRESARIARERLVSKMAKGDEKDELDSQAPRKRRKSADLAESHEKWTILEEDISRFEVQHVQGKGKFAFSFVEGPLVKALRSGDWILLDEINLASPETLEAVSGLLSGPTASITLTEQGSLEPVPRHSDFRLFACMNPATDVGKKDLPSHIRSRFTEIDVPPPDADRETLLSIVTQYIGGVALGDKAAILDVAEFYSATKALSESRQLADGANHRPHFSMRTLARALTFAADIAPMYSLRRALWEGCLMAFTMALDAQSAKAVTALAEKHILHGVKNVRSLLTKEPPPPAGRIAEEFVKFGPFYLERGPLPLDAAEDYIITPSVSQKLIDLARIVSSRRYPVLIEGPTSAGKTSAIEYLARRTGHRFVRINNHEHTDIQEYLGTYVSDSATGALVWRDGLLVQALRQGDWLVLDELNLAPTDVLEALNRLLDDNRELVLPATGEVLRPHPSFVLFATQNPPGLYAGRKVLSRAFRNRFLEVHFADVPQAELERILCERARIAPPYAAKIVAVFQELQKRRQAGRVFESKHAFATLRDLFRWAGRDAVGYQELAENGYMLLAERARREDDRVVVQEVIEEVMRPVKIDPRALYDLETAQFAERLGFTLPSGVDLVWTSAMRRLVILLGRALRFDEPVLLVGETGTGKTSVVQVFADAIGRELFQLSCHQNTETADLIGGLRPVRNRAAVEAEALQDATSVLKDAGLAVEKTDLATALDRLSRQTQDPRLALRAANARGKLARLGAIFEWHDGPLVTAMRSGSVFLLDEISLADDSVLERLNSVLEPARTVVLAERAGGESVTAAQGFKLVATMNPGGDYGKKELSPALRNRFTEIWVPAVEDRADLEGIVDGRWAHAELRPYTAPLLDFCEWLCKRVNERSLLGLRDILAWVSFSNSVLNSPSLKSLPLDAVFHHAAHLVCLDGLGSLPVLSSYTADALARIKVEATAKLQEMVSSASFALEVNTPVDESESAVRLGLFALPRGPRPQTLHAYNIEAPTTRDNAMRVARACQLSKPILLEGSPGVGKTSLIVALAKLCGYHLCRINLSDQTDLADLFGTDLPIEGGKPGEFAWKNAEFLIAMQRGHWVLLDEMNLAPQSVLEGLNAVLDHRGTVFIPELGRSFTKHPSFRIFAAQNPFAQGGGRKGLPKSYVNRFTKVYVEALTAQDLRLIGHHLFPEYPEDLLHAMIDFNTRLQEEVAVKHSFGRAGSPWEFNLRDIARWGAVLHSSSRSLHPIEHLRSIYLSRFRSEVDRSAACTLFSAAFGTSADKTMCAPHYVVAPELVQIGHYVARRANYSAAGPHPQLLQSHLAAMEAMGVALEQQWLVIVTGPRQSGKTSLVRLMADLAGAPLHEVSVNNSTDTTDILGSFEQVDGSARARLIVQQVLDLIDAHHRCMDGSRARLAQARQLRRLVASSGPIDAASLQTATSLLDQLPGVDERVISTLRSNTQALTTLTTTEGRFEWVDGPLVSALKEGHWLLLDNANLCNPSVLDRLNALCEPGGVLTLNEQGLVDGAVPVIVPHPNFRLVMCVDPQHGELSRAMRNRGIEVCISMDRTKEDLSRLQVSRRLPRDASADPVISEARRRGLGPPVPSTTNSWPSGRLLSDSMTSYSRDLAATLLSSPAPPLALSTLLFLTRSLLTSRSVAFLRLLTHDLSSADLRSLLQLANTLGIDGRWSKIDAMRGFFAPIWPVSSDLLRVEPVDFFAKFTVSSPSFPELADVAMRRSLLRSIDIFVRSVAQELTSPEGMVISDASPAQSAQDKHVRDVLFGINAIDQHTRHLSSSFFSDIAVDMSSLTSSGVDTLHALQRMLTFLLKSAHGDLNLSAVQTVAKWLSALLKGAPSSFGEVDSAVAALGRLVTPSTGLGLAEIWTAMRNPTVPNAIITHADSPDLSADLRRELVNLYAMAGLPGSASDRSALTKAIEDVHLRLPGSSPGGTAEHPSTQASAIAVKQLDAAIKTRIGGTGSEAVIVEEFLALAYPHTHIDIRSLVPYRMASWSLKEGRLTVSTSAAALKSWHEALWSSDAAGPALLTRPTELSTLFTTCDWQAVSLDALTDFEDGLHKQVGILTFGDSKARSEKIASLYYSTVLLLMQCFPESFDKDVQRQLFEACSWTQLQGLLARTSHPGLSTALEAFVSSVGPILSSSNPQRRTSFLSGLGRAFICLFHTFVDLYVPDAPLDPAVAQQCEDTFWSTEGDDLAAQLELHASLEHRTTGNESNGVMDYLSADLVTARQHLRGEEENMTAPPRPVARLREYWLEVSQFLSNVVSMHKVDKIVALAEVDGTAAATRESVVQDSIRGFMQRMRSIYGDCQDIDEPLQFALLQLRFGLRLTMAALAGNDTSELSSLARDLVSLPTISVIRSVVSRPAADLHTAGVTAFDHLLLQLIGISADCDAGTDLLSHVISLDVLFEQAVRLWLIDQARQEEVDAAGQSLYRSKAIESEAVNDSEVETEEFLALFPDYENVLAEEPNVDQSTSTSTSATHVEAGRVQALVEAYLYLFANTSTRRRFDPTMRFAHLRKVAAQRLLEAHGDALPDTLDLQAHGFSLAVLHDRMQSVTHHMQNLGKPYDFYLDANVPELRKATKIVQAMTRRLRILVIEWPDQMVLQHLLARCEQVIRLNIHSPVAKILAAIEQLLVQSEDWEMYANRENTLKEYREAFTSLIVEWRRLELASWQGLLETQEAAFKEAVSEWWFRIYNACIRGLFDVVSSAGNLDKFLDELVPLIENFVSSSPLGQFERRLDILFGFERWVKLLAQTKSAAEATALLRVSRVLASTRLYYVQFLPQVAASLSTQRDSLEKNIKSFIKLASWRDVNVQSLKASAKRTHVQLYKSIRKFRDILRQPTLPLLRAEQASGSNLSIGFSDHTASTPTAATFVVPSAADKTAPAYLQNLSRTYERFNSLIVSRVDGFLSSSSHSALRDLAHEVITAANDLANEALPTDSPKERRDKLAKALLVRKRKAWSDLLKELKRIGMAYNVQPQILEQQRSARWLREQPIISGAGDSISDVVNMETYYMKLLGLLPQLRASLSSHSEDIQTRELLRGVNLLESGLSFALDARSRLADGITSHTALHALVDRLQALEGTQQIAAHGSDLPRELQRQHDDLARLAHALAESAELCNMLGDLPSSTSLPNELLLELTSLRAEALDLRDQLSSIFSRMPVSATPIVLFGEYEVTTASTELIMRVSLRLRDWAEKEPRADRILTPVREWAETLTAPFPAIQTPLPSQDNLDHVIDSLLVTIQTLIAAVPEKKAEEVEEDDDGYVKSTNALFCRLTSLLHIDAVSEKLAAAFDKLATCSQDDLARTVPRVLPFVRRYEQLVRDHLSAMASWTGSLFKLEFVVCSVMLSVATKGFCKPPDLDDAGDEGEGGEAVGGVGLGEGTGNQDVSKEIEDESQVEGLQGEHEAEQQKREKGEDNGKDAIEMGEDFEGEMEDVPEDEDGDEKEEEDGEEEEGPDDQVGDLDPLDSNAVDEKLWGDEKGPEGKDDDGKTQDDRSKEAGADSEVVAKEKEGSKKEREKGEKSKEQGQEEAQEGDENQDGATEEGAGEEGEEEQEGEPQGQGAAMDDFVQDANTLDLPEDLDLGQDQKSEQSDDDDEMDELEDDIAAGEETRDAGGRESAEPEPMEQDGADGADGQAQASEDTADDADDEQMDENGGTTAAPDVQAGEQADADAANLDSMNAEARESAAQNQSTSTTGGAGKSAGEGADANDDEGGAEDQEQAGDVDRQQDEAFGRGALNSGPQQGTSTSQESRSVDMQSNPLRSLGDAVQEIRQRFDDILNSAVGDVAPPQLADVSEPSQLEYLRPDDEDQNMQALGPAGAEEAARLQDLKLIDDEADELQDDVAPMDVDEPTVPDTAEPHPSSAALPSQPTAQSLQPGVEDALTQHQLRTPGTANLYDATMDNATVKAEEDIEEALPDKVVEAELRRWKADGQQPESTEHLWRLYESLTHELSYALCEQLRLILEPTQATRLKGDYRTGKRLNMKKIIPYIASEYTKDKIWLRRTRPSQREYQVLIALDDSRSMSESHSVHLAYQTLALVSKALTRLEVGDVGIAKFGEAVEVLHGFDEGPFTDQAGTRVMGAFNFNQRATNVLSLVETSLRILEEARERRAASSSSAADLWQLEIIISDGICQDHERLRTVLRKAEEQRVMIVFIVIDSLQSNAAATATGGGVHDSIVSMKHASYAVVDGRMELQVNRYLDTFPFEYYVVLRNVEALPEVLSGTLKQFFERISED